MYFVYPVMSKNGKTLSDLIKQAILNCFQGHPLHYTDIFF